MRPLRLTNVLAALSFAAVLCACGGLSSGLATSGAPDRAYGSQIAANESLNTVFHRPLNESSLAGNVTVTADGVAAPCTIQLQEGGYRLAIAPTGGWKPGAVIELTLIGGLNGLRYTDGRTFSTVTLVYYVEQR